MPNLGAVLKDEIARLSRKEVRGAIEWVKGASGQHRKDLAALKKQVAELQRMVLRLVRSAAKGTAGVPRKSEDGSLDAGKKRRFSAARLKAMRERMDLSANDLGKLVGVSPQSIYNWEQEKARPRAEQVVKLAELRSLGKRELVERLKGAAGAVPPAAKEPAAAKTTAKAKTTGRAGKKRSGSVPAKANATKAATPKATNTTKQSAKVKTPETAQAS